MSMLPHRFLPSTNSSPRTTQQTNQKIDGNNNKTKNKNNSSLKQNPLKNKNLNPNSPPKNPNTTKNRAVCCNKDRFCRKA